MGNLRTFKSLTATRRTRCAPYGMVLPRLVRRCPDFDNRCPEFWWGERPREPRCPESKTSCPDFLNGCPGFDSHRPDFQDRCPGFVSRCPGFFRLCLEFFTPPPVLKASAPIFLGLKPACNTLFHSNLGWIPARSAQKPSPVLSDTLSHRLGEGRGEGRLFFNS